MDSDEEIDPSRLGTQEYWEDNFSKELELYRDTKDVGEVWFGYKSVKRVVDWICSCSEISKQDEILDIGCGNGIMLIELAKKGYTNLKGVDYSSSAVELSRLIASEQSLNISYEVGDMLLESQTEGSALSCGYQVCLDKGTYDAVSLNPDEAKRQRDRYTDTLRKILKIHGLFIITSCNWTSEELIKQFSPGFELYHTIPTPVIQFGGKTGQKETVLVFRRT